MAKQEIEKYAPGTRYSVVKAGFDLEANKRNYQTLLQNLSSVQVTRDNVNEDLTKDARQILKGLTESKDDQSIEPLQWHKDIMAAFKSLYLPLEEQVNRILAAKKVIAAEIERETAIQRAEDTRIVAAKTAIVDFTNKVANLIGNAKTDSDIVIIEKLIGSEKTKTTVYQEFISDLITQCDGLRPQIKDQKENIRKLQKIEQEEKIALADGDIVTATELRGKKEHIEQVIHETGIRIHEKAYEQAITIDIVAPEVMDIAPKGRTNWKWRVDDIKLLQRKMPHLVKLVPDEESINILLSTKRQDGSLRDKTEEKWNGITFYNDKSFIK